MGINIKYFVISIASIFLSLAVGMFIGFNMNGQDLYLEQQQALIDSLETRFDEFKKENENLEQRIENLKQENEKQDAFIQNTVREIIQNKLPESNIAIIETTNDYFYEDVYEVLELAGANVPISIQYTDKIFSITDEKLEEINEAIGTELETNEDFIKLINDEVSNLLSSKVETEIFNLLVNDEYITYNMNLNSIEELTIDKVLIAGGSSEHLEDKIKNLDVDLINDLKNLEFKVVGTERLDVEKSFIQELKALNVPTVDNINSELGQISLVYVLKGNEGHYGEKSTAESLLPSISVEQDRSEESE